MDTTKLLTPNTFCNVLARARSAKVRGAWEGSAYQSHPCGLLVGNMRLANHWSVHDYCSIVIATTDKWLLGCQDSFAHGNPFPKPVNGDVVSVWDNGRWNSDEFKEALESKVVAILNRALADSAAVESWAAAISAHERYCNNQRRAALAREALALATGAA